ncbi:FmdB family zinc ribbon protein [Halomonas sp. M20]|uniref:FmdB family zinc ribbon protein n=1 Tax=Halomonas sp. M20 TaxID=2763264 RepID=UPI001D09B9E3|nr:zinc ribbon domain-containing protein [Halomonas sp. M20]
MPNYDYICHQCGPFSIRRAMTRATDPADCPRCTLSAVRVISAPFLNTMNGNSRKAYQRNELSADCPKVMSRAELDLKRVATQQHPDSAHRHGCKHDHGAPISPETRRLTGSTDYQQSNKRWMIGH